MQRRLEHYDVINWANNFIEKLLSVKEKQKGFNAKLLTIEVKKQLINDYNKAKARLILLDYDGTLVPFSEDPQTVKPDERLLEILKTLSEDQRNKIVIISGRDKGTLQNWFGTLNIGLVAEHGAWVKDDNEWMTIKPLKNEWKPKIIPILEMYTDMLPGAFVEEKEFSVVWHYRKAESEISSILAKDLVDNLVNFTANIDLQVLQGNKVVEIKNSGVDKGFAALYWISKKDFDFVLAIGDDWTDEDMFNSLKDKNAYTIKVEILASSAKYNVYSYRDVTDILKGLINS